MSERVLQRIESASAVADRDAFCEYLNDTPGLLRGRASISIKLVSFIHVVVYIYEMYL